MLLIVAAYRADLDGPDKVPPAPVAVHRISSVSSYLPVLASLGKMRGWWSTRV